MTEERLKLLIHRLEIASVEQPEILELRKILLAWGGQEMVAPPFFDAGVSRLVSAGSILCGDVLECIMQTSACHSNVASIWLEQRSDLVGIGTGYALSPDGLWRQHS